MVQKARWNVNTRGLVGIKSTKIPGWDPNAKSTLLPGQAHSTTPPLHPIIQNAQLAKRESIARPTLLNRKLFRAKLRELFNSPQLEVQEINGEFHFSVNVPTGFIAFKVDAQKRVHPIASSGWNAHSPQSSAIQQKIITLLKEL